eukprot:CAMPEP_0180439184 /NCGR_PEP_ID=MMETSP1036_2-20121128/12454_1 /TAXON_ID=632150 /ORGANISM="Azadinium spinosum, Strain 3D9" /LENGTH=101 /DNA_ID=CAMNT_0022445309 /DNA_START=266 /DNA_END=571 /DNA_ORIENTATION=+
MEPIWGVEAIVGHHVNARLLGLPAHPGHVHSIGIAIQNAPRDLSVYSDPPRCIQEHLVVTKRCALLIEQAHELPTVSKRRFGPLNCRYILEQPVGVQSACS